MIQMKKLRLRHPIFSRISFQAFKYIIECGYLVKPNKGDMVISEGSNMSNLMIVLYG